MRSVGKLVLIAAFAITSFGQRKSPDLAAVKVPISRSLQTVVVLTKDWTSVTGTAALFERKNERTDWSQMGATFPVIIGRNGLAPDLGFEKTFNDAPILGPIFEKYCDALQQKNDAALESLFALKTLKNFRKGMRSERVRSISKYLENDRAMGCIAENEEFIGDAAAVTILSNKYPYGIMIQFVKESGNWKITDQPPPIEILTRKREKSEKTEGDGHSPAGLFPLTESFGSEPKPATIRMPYTRLGKFTECVDDIRSSFYNRIVNRMQVGNFDWKSSEKMFEIKPEYDLGIFVGYNKYPVDKGRGSCIFLHIWKDSSTPTDGCTAMARNDLERISNWISPEKYPYLVQMPERLYESRRKLWKLPKIK